MGDVIHRMQQIHPDIGAREIESRQMPGLSQDHGLRGINDDFAVKFNPDTF